MSRYFETRTGVKQGCLLSPIMFALYLNDLHEYLGGGLSIDDINIRVLMYADDIVILADDVNILQDMIYKLEQYCREWAMEVNLTKSEIMVFRNGGRLGTNERWTFNGENVRIVNEYKYLGMLLTPTISFTKHVNNRNSAAKTSLNVTWKNFIGKREVSLVAKWKMFLAVCRSMQSYGSQIWGYSCFDDVDKLHRYFIKRILKLPDSTPNYIIALETELEEGHFYTFALHLKYISKTIFKYENNRLPHLLSLKVISKNIYWYTVFKDRLMQYNIDLHDIDRSHSLWKNASLKLIEQMKIQTYHEHITNANSSQHRIYRLLDFSKGLSYCNVKYTQSQISYIMKARSDLLWLNGSLFREEESRSCSLCNLRELESIQHFLGRCPVLNEFRQTYFRSIRLSEEEILYILNGGENDNWLNLYKYVRYALRYRKILISEYNF